MATANKDEAGNGSGAGLMWRFVYWLGRFFKKLAIYTVVLVVCVQIIFAALNLYERTHGAPTFEGPPIPYKQLATEDGDPYSIGYSSQLLSKDDVGNFRFPGWAGKLKRVVKKFPDVRSCLNWREREKKKPDLRKIDWTLFTYPMELDVCLFRIFVSIGTLDGVLQWLKALNISASSLSKGQPCYMSGEIESMNSCSTFLISWRDNNGSIREFRGPSGRMYPYAWGWGYPRIWLMSRLFIHSSTFVRVDPHGRVYQVDAWLL